MSLAARRAKGNAFLRQRPSSILGKKDIYFARKVQKME
jgi:hypothetical protein